MNHRNKPELHEKLAAEYVLGTLQGRARARFKRWLNDNAELRQVVEQWQNRLSPLAEMASPVTPPAWIWRKIRKHIAQQKTGWWHNLNFWRPVALAATGLAFVVLAINLVGIIKVTPVTEEVQPAFWAVLTDPKTQKPVLIASASRNSKQLRIQTMEAEIDMPSDRSLELWAIVEGKTPRSLGLVANAGKTTMLLTTVATQALANTSALAISLEPKGGSRTGAPTGPVLYVGALKTF